MAIFPRRFTGNDADKKIVEGLAGLIAGVKKGMIRPGHTYLTRANTQGTDDYEGREIRKADAKLHANAMAAGCFLKMDIAGGKGGGAISRDDWRVIALFNTDLAVVPNYEYFWKHGADIDHLAPEFLLNALPRVNIYL
jgi:hypothetical protein